MKFPITLYQDEDNWYVVACPIIPGCMSQGKTEKEALLNIQEAIELCIEVRKEQGLPITIQMTDVEIPIHA
jgi:predicted RNase H-like HicB family nuclease